MKRSTKLLVLIATTVSTAAFAGAGWAYWTTSGAGSAAASVGSLAAPTGVTVPETSSGTVAVSWTASSAVSPNIAPQGYYVERSSNGATWSAACGSSPTVFKTSPCNDTVGDGTYTYRVTAVFKSWTAQSAPSNQVTVTTDATPPTLTSLQMFDTNANSKIDQVKATFSEPLASSTATAPWTLANVPSGGSISSVATSGTIATLTLTEGPGAGDTAVGTFTVALAANPGGIRDAAGNQASFAATAPADKAGPVVIKTEMLDQTANGKIDAIRVTYSENVTPVSPATSTNWTLTNVPSSGTLNTTTAITGSGTTQIVVPVTEGAGAADTAVSSFTVASAAGAASDAASNPSVAYAAAAPIDAAGPVIVSATSGGGVTGKMEANDTLTLVFSEPLSPTSVPSTASVSESRSGSTTTFSIANVISNATIDNSYMGGNSTATATGTISRPESKTILITLGAVTLNGSSIGTGNQSVSIKPATAIQDAAANSATTTASASVNRLF